MPHARPAPSDEAMAASALRELRAPLLRWYSRNKRVLPWRRTRDAYAVWVSEIMLQQTQVATVLPYYARFMERFPTVFSLAEANEEDVLALWSGLGYYRRARALYAGARKVVAEHDGHLPRDRRELLALPGVGRYTAGAIASIAFDLPEAILDGNVRRVLARVLALDGARIGFAREERALWDAAAHLVRGPRPGDLNQALMELGATVCVPAEPRCPRCPARRLCRARAEGRPESYPAARARRPSRNVRVAVAWLRRGERIVLERPADGNPLCGTWDLPAIEVEADDDAARALRAKLAAVGLEVAVGPTRVRARHGIMHRRLTLEVAECRLRRGSVAGRPDLRWIDPGKLADAAVSGATVKVARELSRAAGSTHRAQRPARSEPRQQQCDQR